MPVIVAGGVSRLSRSGTQIWAQSPPPKRGMQPQPANRFTVGTVGELWTPAYLSAVKGWYKGDEQKAATVNGWHDASGHGNDAATGGFDPDVIAEALNSLNVVHFTAANSDQLYFPANMVTGWTEGSAFYVVKRDVDPPPANAGPIISFFGSSGQQSHYPWVDGTIYDDFLSTTRQTVGDPGNLAAWHMGSVQSKANDWRYAFNATDFFTTGVNTVGTSTQSYLGFNAAGHFLDGSIAELIICDSFLTTAERQNIEGYLAWKWGLQANLPGGHPYAASPPLPPPITHYSMTADTATFTMTGNAAGGAKTNALLAAKGTFTLTGQVAGLKFGHVLPAVKGAFTFTGNAARLARAYPLAAVKGTFTLTGNAAGLRRAYPLAAASGSFTMTGRAAGLAAGLKLSASAGSFALSGQAAGLRVAYPLAATAGSFALNGQNATFRRGFTLTMANGVFTFTGNAATLQASTGFGAGVFTMTGRAANLKATRYRLLSGAAFVMTGRAAVLRKGKKMTAAGTAFAMTGQASIGVRGPRRLVAGSGLFSFYGRSAQLTLVRTALFPDNEPAEVGLSVPPTPALTTVTEAVIPPMPMVSLAASVPPPEAFTTPPAAPPVTLQE